MGPGTCRALVRTNVSAMKLGPAPFPHPLGKKIKSKSLCSSSFFLPEEAHCFGVGQISFPSHMCSFCFTEMESASSPLVSWGRGWGGEKLASLLWLLPGLFLTSKPLLWNRILTLRSCRLSCHSSLSSKRGAESGVCGAHESLPPPVLPADRRKGARLEGLETSKK